MIVLSPARRLAVGVLALSFAGPAVAQENLDQGKTAAQMFAANCTVCHKKPQGLARPGVSGLDIYLRQHYTASRESAAAMATYLQSVGGGPGAAAKQKGEERTKTGEKKPGAGKSGGPKSGEAKPGDTKPGDTKPGDTKPGDTKPGDAKPTAAKPAEEKPAETKSPETKPAESKPSETKPSDAKPAEPKPSEPAPKSEKPD